MKSLLALFLTSCVGTFDAANTPPTIQPSTTRAHCVALDVESDLLPGVSAASGAIGTGLGTVGMLEDKPSVPLKVTAVILGGVALGTGMWGASASKSWHEQCAPQPAPAPTVLPTPIPAPATVPAVAK